MKSNTTAVFGSRSRFPPDAYSCIVAHGQDLYLVPGNSDHVLRINVVTKAFTTHPFPTSWIEHEGVRGGWAHAIVVQDKIFAIPTAHGACFMLVVRLGSEITFNAMDTRGDTGVFDTYGIRSRNFGVVALDGRVYAGPFQEYGGGALIRVFSAASEKALGSIFVEGGFCGAVVWGRTIVMPSCRGHKLLFANVDTEEVQTIHLPYSFDDVSTTTATTTAAATTTTSTTSTTTTTTSSSSSSSSGSSSSTTTSTTTSKPPWWRNKRPSITATTTLIGTAATPTTPTTPTSIDIGVFVFGSSLYLAPFSNNQFLRVDLENRTICPA